MNFNFTLNPRHWFQKRTPALAAGWAESRNRMRYNALFMLDPDVLVRNLGMFAAGDIAGMERILEDFESRDDKMKVGAFKMAAAVASKPWEVRIAKGEEDNPAAKRHQEVLTRFWNRITVTDAFCRNRRGGLRTLVKQMMGAQSRVYAVHDVSWAVRPDGELEATFTQVPAWNFENRTGELRYLKEPGAYTGVEMKDGEWLVTVGEGVGVTAAILAMAKRLSWNDWLLFSEKCGMPVILGNTGAKEDTPAWNALMAAIKAIAPKTGLLADVESKIQAVPFGGPSGTVTYKELVETVDRAISALYRGGDLATMSHGGDGVGTNAQDGESELMDADGCAMVSETLNRQIERHVVRFTCGDFEPLAGIVLNPPAETEDVDREIKIDMHLAGLGVKLSKADALARYGRTEAEADDDALELPSNAPQNGFQGGFNALPNEDGGATPFKTPKTAFKNDSPNPRPQGDGAAADASEGVLAAFAKDTSKAAEAVKALLDDPTPEKAKALIDDLPNLIPEDPALAAVIAEEMAKEFAVAFPNETPADKPPRSGELKRHNGADEAAAVAHPSHDGLKRHGGVGGTALANELAKEFTVPAGHSQGAGQHTRRQDGRRPTGQNDDTGDAVDANALANTTKNWHKCPKCGKFSGFDGHCNKCNFTLTGNDAKQRTQSLIDSAARDAYTKPVIGLAYRKGLGRIDLPVGKLGEFREGERKHGTGLSKIREKHDADLGNLADTITFGEILRTRHHDTTKNPENPNRKAIVYNGYVCFLSKRGSAWEITTHYKPKDDTVVNLKAIAEAL